MILNMVPLALIFCVICAVIALLVDWLLASVLGCITLSSSFLLFFCGCFGLLFLSNLFQLDDVEYGRFSVNLMWNLCSHRVAC